MCPGLYNIKMANLKKDIEFMTGKMNSSSMILSDRFVEKINLDNLTVDNIEQLIPVNNTNFYLSNVYDLYLDIKPYINEQESVELASQEIEGRISRTLDNIEKYESRSFPSNMEPFKETLIEGLGMYLDGLYCFDDYLVEGDESFILDSLELIYRGDLLVLEFEREMERQLEEHCVIGVA